jgi:hypothetical protein
MYKKFTLCFVIEIDYRFDKALIDDNFLYYFYKPFFYFIIQSNLMLWCMLYILIKLIMFCYGYHKHEIYPIRIIKNIRYQDRNMFQNIIKKIY